MNLFFRPLDENLLCRVPAVAHSLDPGKRRNRDPVSTSLQEVQPTRYRLKGAERSLPPYLYLN